eukprot:1268352-Alexandrium_andersonii.AAC.1
MLAGSSAVNGRDGATGPGAGPAAIPGLAAAAGAAAAAAAAATTPVPGLVSSILVPRLAATPDYSRGDELKFAEWSFVALAR